MSRRRGENPDQILFDFVDQLPDLTAIIHRRPPAPKLKLEELTSGLPKQAIDNTLTDLKAVPGGVASHLNDADYLDYLVLVTAFALLMLLVAEVVFNAGLMSKYFDVSASAPLLRTLSFAFLGLANLLAALLLQARAISLRSKANILGLTSQGNHKKALYQLAAIFYVIAVLQFILAIVLTADDIWIVIKNIGNVIITSRIPWPGQ